MNTPQNVADTIRKQLGVFGLGVVGASDLAYGGSLANNPDALTFKARLHFVGQTRVRKMRVVVSLNGKDLYDVDVQKPDLTMERFAEDVYADQLTETMYRLDSEGVSK